MQKNFGLSVIGFYGYSQSGKTTVIERLIKALRKNGIRVGVIKVTDKDISSEPTGKDTYTFRDAGAEITSFASQIETNFVIPKKNSIEDVIKIMLQISNVDLIIVEGANDLNISKIRIGEVPQRKNTIFRYDDNYAALEEFVLDVLKGNLK